MRTAALDDADSLLAMRRDRAVLTHELRVAQDAVERRTQLMADGADVAALGLIGLMPRFSGHQTRLLQGLVGLAVRLDLAHQQVRLAIGFFLRDLPALVCQYQPPRCRAGTITSRAM